MNDMRKYEYDAQKYAAVTYDELDEMLHLCFQQSMYDHHSGIDDVPIRRWREGVTRFPVDIPDDIEEFRREFGLRFTKSVRSQGIQFEGLFYNSEALAEIRNTMNTAKSNTLVFTVDPTDIRQIFVVNPKDGSYLTVPCLQKFSKPMPLFLQQRLRELQHQKGKSPMDEHAVEEATGAINAQIDSIRAKKGKRGKVDATTAQMMASRAFDRDTPDGTRSPSPRSNGAYTKPTEDLLKAAKAKARARDADKAKRRADGSSDSEK